MANPKLVLVVIDGLRPEALSQSDCPTLQDLQRRGAWTLNARADMPSVTMPCHMSMFHSVPVTRHGISSNTWTPMARPLPGLVEQIRAAERTSAFFYGWDGLRNLCTPGMLTHAFFREKRDLDNDDAIATAAVRCLTDEQPDFSFIHFDTVDGAGHRSGWLSEGYLHQVTQVDAVLERVLDAIPDQSTIMVLSDHGGHDRTHGTDASEDMTIPWLIAGPTIRPNYAIKTPVDLLSIAPTIARTLQITPAADWEGTAVEEIFIEPA